MFIIAISFLIGVLALQIFSFPPDRNGILLLAVIFLTLVFFIRKKLVNSHRKKMLVLSITSLILGFTWCVNAVYLKTRWVLPSEMEGVTVTAWGQIDTIPNPMNHLTSFIFRVHKLQLDHTIYKGTALVRLTWRQKQPVVLHIGDECRLKIRLKKIHGVANPGSFDFEAYALEEGIRASGYAVDREENVILHPGKNNFGWLREQLKERIENNLPPSNTSHWIPALVVGERHNIDQSQWNILRSTGTNHLMSIAGLHIGFMAAFIYWIVNHACRLLPSRIVSRLLLIYPAQTMASAAALCMAIFYSALAGFSLPTQRACVMLSIFLMTRLAKIKLMTWQAWSVALLIILLMNPLSVLTESFWLSFGAVALIIYGSAGLSSMHSLWSKWGRVQWITAVGLLPLCLWLFQQGSLVSFLANAIAIPWVGFTVVPLSLIGSFLLFVSNKLGTFILLMADTSLSYLWSVLTWLAHFSWATWYYPILSLGILMTSMVAVCLLLLPAGFPGRLFSFIWFIPLLTMKPAEPKFGEMRFTLLDVGQGLATVVQTQHHALIFDTGAKLSPNYDMGESVVVPFLRQQMISKIDMLVVSHGDNDHKGGVDAVLREISVRNLRTSVPEEFPLPMTQYCLRGQSWEWEGVQFKFLYPTKDTLDRDNDSSCVLSVANSYHRILLTGDIEKFAEKNLVEYVADDLPTSILVAPHHGSKTSIVDSFLEKVHPQYVLFPVGYRNRYHFPHSIVLQKYDQLGSIQLNTADQGALIFSVRSDIDYQAYRQMHHFFWNS